MTALNPKVMYIFPGQGSQYRGMGSDIYEEFDVAKSIYDNASRVLGYDVAELSFEDPKGRLDLTEFTQPALLTHSIACLEVFKMLGGGRIEAATTAGHSLGEYSALVAAGALTFEDALALVRKRGALMSAYGKGKMVALNLDVESIRVDVNDFYCDVGGCNTSYQTVVGGAEEDLKLFVEYVKTKAKTMVIALKTEGAFHTYHMIEAANRFRPILESTNLIPPKIGVISNHTGKYHSSHAPAIKANLFFQLWKPVRWIWGMQEALKEGLNVIFEFGGGLGKEDTPVGKRPGLESITKKALGGFGHHAIYLPAINSATIKEAVRSLRMCEKVADEVPHNSDHALDDNLLHLFLPVKNGIVTEESLNWMRRVDELGLGKVVKLVAAPLEDRPALDPWVAELVKDGQPCLEVRIGSSANAFSHYHDQDRIEQELLEQREKFAHAGHSDLDAGVMAQGTSS